MDASIVGIDLGTTNSVVATVDENGRVVILPSPSGAEITPSVVYFEPDGSVRVGSAAIAASAADPDNGVRLVKRAMGAEFPLHVRGQDHTPESISALILRHLSGAATANDGRPCASEASGGKVRAVITVPAYFGTREREATHQAGVIAGLDVLELLDEPVAAATHYGLTAGDRTLLVCDLGGGTFDTTVLRIRSGAVQVLATDGQHELGGADVDGRLLGLIMERLGDQLSPAELDALVGDPGRCRALALEAEAVKKDLSTAARREVRVNTTARHATVTVSRADLDAVCADLYGTTAEIIGRVLAAARLGSGNIDEVIMMGGSSRIPALSQRLCALLGKAPRLVEPDLAVAKGAALRAHHLAGSAQFCALIAAHRKTAGRTLTPGEVAPVTPRAIGILIEDSNDPRGERSYVQHLVAANVQLPAARVRNGFGTILPGQDCVRIQVYEQAGPVPSAEVGHNRRVLDGELTGLGRLPAGSVIRLTVKVAVDGRLTVIAHEPGSGRELLLEAFIEGVIDGAETERLTTLVGRSVVRG
jgi:molecular chaperone DnaK (HSP70)